MSHTHTHSHEYSVEVKNLPETGEVEITGTLSAKEFAEYVKNAFTSVQRNYEVPGFRKGKAPEKMIREQIGMNFVLEEAAEEAISHLFPHILSEKKIDAVGRPKVTLSKLEEKAELGFTIVVAIVPEIKSLDYKKAAAKKNAIEVKVDVVTEKEIEDAIKHVLSMRGGEGEAPKELTDEVAQSFGGYKNADEFKVKLKENLVKEKEYRASEKRRLGLFEGLIEATEIKIPEAMIEGELDRLVSDFKRDVERMGATFEEYMAHAKKTETDMRKEWRKDAEKRATLEIILEYVAKKEKVSADEKRLETETTELMKHYKDIDHDRARSYVEGMLIREATIKFLESVK
jgi:trigger factor